MKLINWSKSYDMNVPYLDDQHKHLASLINKLADAKAHNQDQELHASILREVVAYTQIHFRDEEEYMKKIAYPHFHEHQKQHQILIKEVIEILQDYKSGKTDITDRVLDILNNWLIKHILRHDHEITKYLEHGA